MLRKPLWKQLLLLLLALDSLSLEGLITKLKLQYFGHLMRRANPLEKTWLIGKNPDAGKDWGQEEKGTTEDEMVGWHHRLNGQEFEQTLGDSEGQGSLVCCSPGGSQRGRRDWATEQQQDQDNGMPIFWEKATSGWHLGGNFLKSYTWVCHWHPHSARHKIEGHI